MPEGSTQQLSSLAQSTPPEVGSYAAGANPADHQDPFTLLESGRFDTVLLVSPDLQGRLVGKRMPAERFRARPSINVCTVALAWDIQQSLGMPVALASWDTGYADVQLVADTSTLRPAAWLDRTAICFGDFLGGRPQRPLEVAPRNILQRQVDRMTARGLTATVATEPEFFLFHGSYDELRRDGYRDLTPTGASHADYVIERGNEFEDFFGRTRRLLRHSGIPIDLAQAEWGRGQWEINLGHQGPLQTADAHALFKMAIRDLARQNGYAATFMAKPVASDIGSSCHIHLSLSREDGQSAFWDRDSGDNMSALMRSALAGVLARLPECMLLYAPTVNSYRRLGRHTMAGYGQTWGFDNRTVSCRVAGDTPESLRFELRLPGADVNPYLAIGAILASVLDGLEHNRPLSAPVEGSGYDQPIDPLPNSLQEAADAFSGSKWAGETFGEAVVEHYATAARYEAAQFGAAVTDWELQRYFDAI